MYSCISSLSLSGSRCPWCNTEDGLSIPQHNVGKQSVDMHVLYLHCAEEDSATEARFRGEGADSADRVAHSPLERDALLQGEAGQEPCRLKVSHQQPI